MNRVFQLRGISSPLIKESKAHRIVSIRNRESHRMMEQSSRRRQECFAENHGSDRCGSNKFVTVIERLDSSRSVQRKSSENPRISHHSDPATRQSPLERLRPWPPMDRMSLLLAFESL